MKGGLYPQGVFHATPAERAAMHEADAAMRVANLARHLIDTYPDTADGRAKRLAFLGDVSRLSGPATREAVEKAARAYWKAKRGKA